MCLEDIVAAHDNGRQKMLAKRTGRDQDGTCGKVELFKCLMACSFSKPKYQNACFQKCSSSNELKCNEKISTK